MDRIAALRTFVLIADHESFTAAAERRHISRSVASKQITFLENEYGVRLMRRTTRRLSLTDDGFALYRRARDILAGLDALDSDFQQRAIEPHGRLRLSAPQYVGTHYIAPVMARLAADYPDIQLDIDLSDRRVDLIADGYDLVVRIGELEDSNLIARRLGETGLALVAAPEYLERHGRPDTPDALAGHDLLWYRYGRRIFPDIFERRRPPEPKYRANSGAVLRELALAGRGIALLPHFEIADALASGRLVRILEADTPDSLGIYAVHAAARHIPARLRIAIDALVEAFADFRR